MKTLKHLLIGLCIVLGSQLNAQNWETSGNIVNPGDFIGSTNDEFFDVHQNDVRRVRFRNVNWPGYNAAPVLNNANRIHFPIGTNNQVPFSMMHLGYNTPSALQRPWMNVGTTYGAGSDIMYTGIIQSPGNSDNPLVIDAVVAWGCNDDIFAPGNGPDNLRFLFIAPTTATASPGSAPEGLETMRITPWGNVGIGADFSNDLQPQRRAVVQQRTDSAQFRIAWSLHENPVLGRHTDFQVSSNANLFVKPRNNGQSRSMAVGFLADEQDPPINGAFGNSNVWTALDVGGTTRIRMLSDTAAHSIITGYYIDPENPEDNFLTRIDFPTGEDANCFVLNGEGEWIDVCNLSGGDFDWEYNVNDVWTGHGQNGFPARNVGVGNTAPQAKLDVFTQVGSPDDPTASFGVNVVNNADEINSSTGINVTLPGLCNVNVGLASTIIGQTYNVYHTAGDFLTRAPGKFLYGVRGRAVPLPAAQGDPAEVYGVRGDADLTGSEPADSYGVAGFNNGMGASSNYGVYGEAPLASNNWAGFFNGNFFFSGAFVGPGSDESIKTGIETIEGVEDILAALSPVQYHYITGTTGLNLPEGLQYGLIAQEVEEVIPELVHGFNTPQKYDSLGNVLSESQSLKAVNYLGFVPLLIASHQAQDAMIAAQDETLAAMQSQLESQSAQISALQESLATAIASIEMAKSDMDHCCKDKPAAPIGPASGKVELDQNVPNPFSDQTRIDFSLPQNAHVRLVISDSQGRVLETLMDSQQPAGPHTTTWDGSRYSPGMYYYSLFANGQLLTKKMIKR